MSAFAMVCAAAEQVTRVRRRLSTKIIADCPVCRRARRLEVSLGRDSRVVFICHGGCDRERVRKALDLPWSAFFEDVLYEPAPNRSARRHVLGAVDGTRWTITTHDFADDADFALAVEVVERLLPARYRVRDWLRRRTGERIEWNVFPLTASFVQDLTAKLGRRIGEHRAARLIRLLLERGLIEHVDTITVTRQSGATRVPIFRLAEPTTCDGPTMYAHHPAKPAARSSSPASAMPMLLSAGEKLSRAGLALPEQGQTLPEALKSVGRSPPIRPESTT